jgi:2-polyprenyl-3-methyl-5-hydroxy-6-metoxy-1,4-benzoquinol methylase
VTGLALGTALRTRTRAWARHSPTVRRWRESRYTLFMELCAVRPDEQILDVGAGIGAALERYNSTNPIVALDLVPREAEWLSGDNVTLEQGDGTRMEFADGAFPVVFSSSVIEHVPKAQQAAFASEIRRVGGRYFVQTPNRWFPIEPHYQFPFFQFLPERIQRALNRRFTLGWQQKGQWDEVELLSARQLRRMFPDAEIHRERVLGLSKSLMAVRRESPS